MGIETKQDDELDIIVPLIDDEEEFITISISDVIKGEEGFSPIATVTQTDTGAIIEITDKTGTTTAQIFNGEKGEQGEQGEQGKDGNNAKINGYDTVNIVAGDNITLEQQDETLTINAKQYDDTDIQTHINSIEELVIELDKDLTNTDNEIVSLKEEMSELEENINHLDDTKADKDEIPDVSKFITKAVNDLINYYTKTEVNSLISAIKSISMKIVPEKPEVGESNIIYLIPNAKAKTENIYDEYVYIDGKWEIIGSTEIDLSNYYTIEQINTLLFDYITSNDLEDILENYAKVEMLDDYAKVETLENYVENDKFNTLVEKVADIELFKFPNAIIHGEPIINNGQVSGFTRETYLSLPAIFNLHDRGFEFNLAFRTGNDVTTPQNILGSKFCMALFIENSKIKLRVSSNGTSWNLVDIEGDLTLQPNTTYYIQIYFDKLTYKIKYSLDGEEYIDTASKVASVSPYPTQIYLGIGNNFFNPFQGIINLNRCNLKINRSVIWQRNGRRSVYQLG